MRSDAVPLTGPGAAFCGSRDAVALRTLARARRRRRANGVQKVGDSCSAVGFSMLADRASSRNRGRAARPRWRAFSVGERHPATHGFPRRWVPYGRWRHLLASKKRHNSDRLAKTYTKAYTVTHSAGGKARRFNRLRLAVKHLKSAARKGVRVRVPVPALARSRGWLDGAHTLPPSRPPTVLRLS